jgi:hypothetical protein
VSDERELSELPSDEAYWEGLETRIVSDLRPRVRDVAAANAGAHAEPAGIAWWAPLAARALPLGGLAAAAAVATLLFASERVSRTDRSVGILAIPDDDPAFSAFVLSPSPPPIASFVIAGDMEGSR